MKLCEINLIGFILLISLWNGVTTAHNVHTSHGSGEKRQSTTLEDAEYWRTSAIEALSEKLKDERIVGVAKNVIIFLGDGWDITTVTAARILKGQRVDNVTYGEEDKLYVESFPDTGFSKTYCTDSQVADSACSGTAYLCGIKTNSGIIGVTPNVQWGDCPAGQDKKNHVSSILAWAQAAGKSTGIVTTTRVTHASPAATYAHVADRDWECDADVSAMNIDPETCTDIAEQLILENPGRNINVIMGGGRRKFFPNTSLDSEGNFGQREDGQNLIETWKQQKSVGSGLNKLRASYVENLTELENVDVDKTDYLLGLFSPSHMPYCNQQAEMGDPGLPEMTKKAIQILKKNPKGFFLFVEGGKIDLAHHTNQAQLSLWEAIEFDRSIKIGDEMTDDRNTLIVVTADHGHTFSFAGYAERGNDILGIAGIGDDDLPYSTLNYANGPGWKPFLNDTRYNISQDDLDALSTQQVPLVPLNVMETHGGQDVQIFAKGPFSYLFGGTHEQNYIPYVMGYASCVGDGPKYCKNYGQSSVVVNSDTII